MLRYKFPNEENTIESRTFPYDQNKKSIIHKKNFLMKICLDYELDLKSTHSIILKKEENIKNIINDRNALVLQMIWQKERGEAKIGLFIIFISIE